LIYWAVNMGFAIAPTAAGLLATRSYATLFLGDAATTLLFGVAVVALVSETRPSHHHEPHPLSEYLAPYRGRAFISFCLTAMLIGAMFHQVGTTLAIDVQAHGLSPKQYGLLLSLNGVLITLLQPFVSRVTRRTAKVRVLTTAALLVGVGLGINALAAG